ncbi:helix-turn-helix transcriptional regulator [Spirulina sp. 06S082]|uniref:helix-turn-helix domain-containing protein n=1 Tax=Spirulina sp. 06S082 TaxID=3110248 RepID=UPI002B210081|nr:helix-turn-helix transcriptional regulator [Spirulina sp. 06S082]MEA5471681.1 helix-turn-helix transcriptional regulator [Spirulina sp. 06S082]
MSKVAELRKQKKLTQRELADLIGVDPSTIRNWERDRGGVDTFVKVAKLCEALECNPFDLYDAQEIGIDEDSEETN